jgi:hypothetical protein
LAAGVDVVKSCERVGTGLAPTPQAVTATNPTRTITKNDLRKSGISEFYPNSKIGFVERYAKIDKKLGGANGNYPCED